MSWQPTSEANPWAAEDLLVALDATLAAPDPVTSWACDLGQVETDGGVVTREIATDEWHALGRRWLEQLRARFVPVYERLTGGPRA